MRTAIAIPTFNGSEQLMDCIQALSWAAPREDLLVVVADSGSNDGTPDQIRRLHPWVEVIDSGEDSWWTGSTNAAIRYSERAWDPERFCLLNHDCIMSETAYEALASCARSRPASIVCSSVRTLDGRWLFAGGVSARSGMLVVRGWGLPGDIVWQSGRVQWCGGMGVLVPREVFDELKGFDSEAFPHYYADADFCLRAWGQGRETWFCADAEVLNDKSSTGLAVPRNRATGREVGRTLVERKSSVNLRDTIAFYLRHRGILAVAALVHLYARHSAAAAVRFVRRR